MTYELIDSGEGRKLEKFGSYFIDRPSSQATWKKIFTEDDWRKADAVFERELKKGWQGREKLPSSWWINVNGITCKISLTDFGHLGVFPEHASFWPWMQKKISEEKEKGKKVKVLNLFGYSGGATLACAKAGAEVCHVDASKGMVSWARENAEKNFLNHSPIRWIIDDANKFIKREVRRGNIYDGILLDPPTFGRGAKGEVFKIEEDLVTLLQDLMKIFSKNLFFLLTCHTPGYTPLVLKNLLMQVLETKEIEANEMFLSSQKSFCLPSGCYAKWER